MIHLKNIYAVSFGLFLLCLSNPTLIAQPQDAATRALTSANNGGLVAPERSDTDSSQLFRQAHTTRFRSNRENNEAGLITALLDLARYHELYGQLDSAIYYFMELKELYKKAENPVAVAETCIELKGLYGAQAAYAKSLEQVYEALAIYEDKANQRGVALCYTHICDLLYYEDKYSESVDYCDMAIAIQEELNAREDLALSYRYKASSLLFVEGALEAALATINKAIAIYNETGEQGAPLLASLNGRGNILKYMERYDEALADYRYIYERTLELSLDRYTIPSIANIGHVLLMQKKYAEALPYHLKAIELMKESGNTKNLWENYMHVSDIYAGLGDYKAAYDYNILYSTAYQNYLFTIIDRLETEAQVKYESAKKDETIVLQEEVIASQKRTQLLYISIAFLLIVSLIGMLQSRYRIRKKQKEIVKSKEELQQSLENLKATQAQLIHAEKMASLGELTAGIAHEIQNPLNFVNNFSDVSVDLLQEMEEEMTGGNTQEVHAIATDLIENLQKISHHGQRASSIVKGMLEHSRTGTGQKEPTDINLLADEYLRLAYHGLRAKDQSFKAEFHTELAKDLPHVPAVPQDIGRVLLNLINNAFYAVSAKNHDLLGSANLTGHDAPYQPLVTVSTKKLSNSIEIRVSDNGAGIPDAVLQKIFQPFFTTKPTGEGTGLGLSLSYDIITKGHNGELQVSTKEGDGTEFIIELPIN